MSVNLDHLQCEKGCAEIHQNTIWSHVRTISSASEYLSSEIPKIHILLCLCMVQDPKIKGQREYKGEFNRPKESFTSRRIFE